MKHLSVILNLELKFPETLFKNFSVAYRVKSCQLVPWTRMTVSCLPGVLPAVVT